MIDIIMGFITTVSGVVMAGFGLTLMLAGFKILYTGIQWVI